MNPKPLLCFLAAGICQLTLGQYVLAPGYPSGGKITPSNASYSETAAGYGGKGTTVIGTASCSGAITFKWNWSGTGQPPPSVLLAITSSVNFNGASGNCDDGISEKSDTPPSGSAEQTTYDLVEGSGGTITETIDPSSMARGGALGRFQLMAQVSVWVKMSVLPCQIHFTDANGVGPDNARQYFIGQNVKAALSISAPVTQLKWSVAGGSPFSSYAVSQSSGVLTTLPTNVLGAQFSGYFAVPSRPSLNCSFALGGSIYQISQSFTENAPLFSVFKQQAGTEGGYPSTNPTGLYTFGDDYTDTLLGNLNVGVDFGADLTSPGQFQYVQLTNMARKRSSPSQTLEMPWPPGSRKPAYVTSGLDTIYPSFPTPTEEPDGYFPSGAYFYDYDSPLQTFEGAGFTNYAIDGESFVTTLLYLPPGTNSMNVPIESWSWSWGCAGSAKDKIWTAPDSAMMTPTAATAYGSFPTWSNYVSGANAIWR